MTMQVRLERQLSIAQRLLFAAVLAAVSYIAVIGWLVFGQ